MWSDYLKYLSLHSIYWWWWSMLVVGIYYNMSKKEEDWKKQKPDAFSDKWFMV